MRSTLASTVWATAPTASPSAATASASSGLSVCDEPVWPLGAVGALFGGARRFLGRQPPSPEGDDHPSLRVGHQP
eukprot:7469983-Pyramimonas_sp.AAC.2